MKAIDVAKWFIKNGYDSPRDTYEGNMKLQKLLYFAQLIHVAKYNELLFSDEMRAYENGTVINNVRLLYKSTPTILIRESQYSPDTFGDFRVNETLRQTAEIFGDMSAEELSELNHELNSWKIPFYASKTNNPNVYDSSKNVIKPLDGIFMEDVKKVKQMLDAFEENDDSMDYEVINGITFYYDSDEISLTDDILAILEEINGPDTAYTISLDEEQGIIIS